MRGFVLARHGRGWRKTGTRGVSVQCLTGVGCLPRCGSYSQSRRWVREVAEGGPESDGVGVLLCRGWCGGAMRCTIDAEAMLQTERGGGFSGHHRHRKLKPGTRHRHGLVARMASCSCLVTAKSVPQPAPTGRPAQSGLSGVRRSRSGASPLPVPLFPCALAKPPSRAGALNPSLASTEVDRPTHLNDAVANSFHQRNQRAAKGERAPTRRKDRVV